MLSSQHERDRLDVLTRDVESAQRAYDLGSQRAKQMALESRLDQSSVAVLSIAPVPAFPAFPRLFLNSALAAVFGGLAGLGVALLLELKNRLVRSALDLSEMGLPVLSEVPRLIARTPRVRSWWSKRQLLRRVPSLSGSSSL